MRKILLLLAAMAALLQVGCATNKDAELSERPWNAPKNWEHGVPTGIMQGR